MDVQHPHRDNGAEMVHELAILKHAFEATAREREWLHQALSAAQEREHDYREQLAWLRRRLEQAEARYDQVVKAVGSGQWAVISKSQSQLTTDHKPQATTQPPGTRQELRLQILAWLRAHPGPHRRQVLDEALGAKNLTYTLRHMADDGIVIRVAPGVFQAGDQP